MATVERQTTRRPPRPKMSEPKSSRPSKTRPKPKPKTEGGFLGRSAINMVVYGPPGVGKTSFASYFPKPGFVIDPQEDGIRTLVEYDRCPKPVFVEEAADFEALLQICNEIARGDYDIKTAVFDSLTGFEKLCFHYHCREYFDNDWTSRGFYSYQQGPKNAAKVDWPRFLDVLDDIRKAGINVVVIGHSMVKPYNNPEGADYDRFTPYLDKETWAQTHRWAKAVLFYNYHVDLDKAGPKPKARFESEARFLYAEWSPAFDSKNQYGLEALIDAGESGEEAFKNFKDAMKK